MVYVQWFAQSIQPILTKNDGTLSLFWNNERISTINLAGKEYEYHVNHRYNNRFIFFMNMLDNKTIILDETDTKQDT